VGCGRTGSFFAFEQAALPGGGAWPDFVCLSKGISGGYLPLSLVMTRRPIYEAFPRPTTWRAAFCIRIPTPATRWPAAPRWRVLDRFEQDDVLRVNAACGGADPGLSTLERDAPVEHFRQRGMIWAFERARGAAGRAAFAERFHLAAATRAADPPDRPHRLPDAAYVLDDALSPGSQSASIANAGPRCSTARQCPC
jgi:adenosylmethionine-8-amino-7-oxononanoate aminotransferase